MKKKFLVLPFLALCMLFLTGISVFAEQSGSWEYELSEVGLTITAYHGSDKKVVIPDEIDGYKVSAIGKRAFADNHTITSVVIPEGISSIYAEAFFGCSALSRVEFNAKNCTVPGVWIFDDKQGAGVFSGAGSASSKGLEVIFGSKVSKVPEHLFDTASLEEYGHTGKPYAYVTSVTFSDGVKEIGSCAFRNCQELETVSFGQKEQTIGSFAFWGCSSLKEVTFGKALTTINENAFCGSTSLETISWGENLETIGAGAFRECTSLEQVAFVSPLTTLGRRAFCNCTALKDITLPETLTSLQAEAFCGCIKLNQVTVNSINLTVPNIWIYDEDKGAGVFSGAGSASPDGLAVTFGPRAAKVPDHLFDTASLDEYGKTGNSFAYVSSVTFSEGVKEIGTCAFRNCQSLETITFAQSIQSIDPYAFWGCIGLHELTFGGGLTTIGDHAFAGNTDLEKIIWAGNLDSIGSSAFEGCTSLGSLYLVNPLTTVDSRSFKGCTSLKRVILPETLTSLNGEAFAGCINLHQVIIRSSNLTTPDTWIYDDKKGAGVFSGAGSASPDGLEVVFYTGVTRIPAHIFDTASIDEYGKGNQPYAYVTSVICASTVKEVGNCAFRSCQSLETVQFYGKDAAFGESVFDKCISPSFCISAPDGGAIRTYAEENKLTFKTFSGNEVLPEIGEPETAVPAQQEAETAGESSTVEPKADSADKAKTDISSDSAEPESWTCPNGHTGNTGRFCPVCGSEKP